MPSLLTPYCVFLIQRLNVNKKVSGTYSTAMKFHVMRSSLDILTPTLHRSLGLRIGIFLSSRRPKFSYEFFFPYVLHTHFIPIDLMTLITSCKEYTLRNSSLGCSFKSCLLHCPTEFLSRKFLSDQYVFS